METIESPIKSNNYYAGFWLRFAAFLVDRAILSVVTTFMVIPSVIIIISISASLSDIQQVKDLFIEGNLMKVSMIIGIIILLSIFNLILGWLYFSLMESSKYCGTLGKIAVGIKVTDLNGDKLTFGRATGRYFAKIITNLTFLIGYILAGITERKQALHDLISNCLVVQKQYDNAFQ
jgi:uncharacterized RDD family membrane protein YckC